MWIFIIYLIKFQITFIYPISMHYNHFDLYLLHCTWLGCITSCTKNPSHGFLANRWLVHSWFVGLGNPLEVVVHNLLIRRMDDLSYWDEFPMVSALVCMVIHCTWPIVSHDLRLSSSHGLTKFHCVVSQSWDNIEFVLSYQ